MDLCREKEKEMIIKLTPKQVKKALKDLGWSKIETALKMNITVDTVENWCRGKTRCKGPAALLLMDFLEKNKGKKQ